MSDWRWYGVWIPRVVGGIRRKLLVEVVACFWNTKERLPKLTKVKKHTPEQECGDGQTEM